MNIKTKFNINDIVYPIRMGGYSEFVKCETCDGKGNVNVNNTDRTIACPDCYGRGGSKEYKHDKWFVEIDSMSKIGKIATETNRKNKSDKDVITYMLDNTGIGSGTLWNEKSLFLTYEDAKFECDKRNELGEDGEQPKLRTQGGGL